MVYIFHSDSLFKNVLRLFYFHSFLSSVALVSAATFSYLWGVMRYIYDCVVPSSLAAVLTDCEVKRKDPEELYFETTVQVCDSSE